MNDIIAPGYCNNALPTSNLIITADFGGKKSSKVYSQ